MLLPDGTVLMHAGEPYDAAKAHAYYLQYRKLHPRAAGAAPTPAGKKPSTFTVTTGANKTVKLSAQALEEQKVYAAARVAGIQKKLNDLNAALKKRVAAAAKANKPKTAAEKAKEARDAKAYRAKHKLELATKAKTAASKAPAKPAAKKGETIVSLKKSIETTKATLKAEVAKQRELSTAKKNG